MGKKLPYTPNSKIRAALRRLSLQSRERAAALKRDNYTCQFPGCGRKQSRAKGHEVYVEAHHIDGDINWQEMYDVIRRCLLCDPENLITLCRKCHSNVTEKKNSLEVNQAI